MIKIIFVVCLIPLFISLIESTELEGGSKELKGKARTVEFAKAITKDGFKEVEAKAASKISADGRKVDIKAKSKAIADLKQNIGPIAKTDSHTKIKTHCESCENDHHERVVSV